MSRPNVTGGETLCSEGDFSVVRSPKGKVAALWKNHGQEFDSLEELTEAEILNQHELYLLSYGVKK